jgi:RNA polymerase sigma-70 factor (ECF subfamily)
VEALEIDRGNRDCLRRIVRPRRLAVVCNLHGHSAPETARLLGWTVKKVEHLVSRGLHDLRACLERKGLVP